MPLRDHFHAPISKRSSWEGFHGLWPGIIVQQLVEQLPDNFVAEPRVHLGSYYEINVCAFEQDDAEKEPGTSSANLWNVRNPTATQTLTTPVLTFDAEFPEQYAYEVLVYDLERERRLGAAIEIVCPANKDRPESRQLFVSKCYNLLRKDVCLSIVDLVTNRQFNLYSQLLDLLNCNDPRLNEAEPIYAATCRKRLSDGQTKLDTWSHPLAVGKHLPALPVWLSETQAIALELESSYEETCRILRIN